jgi:hypothetical protein
MFANSVSPPTSGQDVDLQHRAERRHLVARHVGMPELAVGDLLTHDERE